MMDLGSGIAIGGFWIAAAPVAIVAIRTINNKSRDGSGKNDLDAVYPCAAHSGFGARLDGLKEGQDRQEKWMSEISADVKRILQR